MPQNTPYAETRPVMYNKMIQILKRTSWSNIQIGSLNRQLIEEKLSPSVFKMTPVGCLIESECIMVWRNVNDDFLFNSHKDIAWQAVLNYLPTRAFLKRRGCSRLSLCPRIYCGEEDNKTLFVGMCLCPEGLGFYSIMVTKFVESAKRR